MLVIRFSRVGKKNRAQFRIVAQERTAAPSGKHIEILGSYDPHFKKGVFKKERIKHWIKNGAQVSDSVYNILIKQGIIKGKKRLIKITAKKEKGKPASAPASVPPSSKLRRTSKTPADKEATEGKKEKTEEINPEGKGEVKEEKKEKLEEKKTEEKVEEEKNSPAADPAKPEKTGKVKKEEKKEEPEKKEGG